MAGAGLDVTLNSIDWTPVFHGPFFLKKPPVGTLDQTPLDIDDISSGTHSRGVPVGRPPLTGAPVKAPLGFLTCNRLTSLLVMIT